MKVYITLDYELFFGLKSGSAKECILDPTEKLLAIAEKHGINLNFFVDSGYLLALEKYSKRYPSVGYEKEQVFSQIKRIVRAGHDCQLHIHPHWEDSYHDGDNWRMNTERYRLDQFSPAQIKQIIESYFSILKEVSGNSPIAYRAGGWCLPLWDLLTDTFKKLGVWIDSTIYENGYMEEGAIRFDFRNAPALDQWLFENDPFKTDPYGSFMELPISSTRTSPLFFWNLYIKGRLNRSLHKSMGNGVPVAQKSIKKKLLTEYSYQAVSCDGYFSGMLQEQFNKRNKTNDSMVIIGHPKAQTLFSLEKLDAFIGSVKEKCHFARYSDLQQ